MVSQQNSPNENPINKDIIKSMLARISKYRQQARFVMEGFRRNPQLPQLQKAREQDLVGIGVKNLEILFNEITPYIRNIRKYTPDILDQTEITASYFLFGKVFQSWHAVFALAKEGFHYEVMKLLRSIKESNDLIVLFMEEGNSSKDLEKWFGGKIVSNAKSRAALNRFMNKQIVDNGVVLPIEKMKSGIYSALSKYNHVSYAALLDSFDPYRQDFDFDRVSGFHYVLNASLPFANDEMQSTIITLRHFYRCVGDGETDAKIKQILMRVAPKMFDKNLTREMMDQAIKRYS